MDLRFLGGFGDLCVCGRVGLCACMMGMRLREKRGLGSLGLALVKAWFYSWR